MRIKCQKKRPAPLEPEQTKSERDAQEQIDIKAFIGKALNDSDAKDTLLKVKSIKDHLRHFH